MPDPAKRDGENIVLDLAMGKPMLKRAFSRPGNIGRELVGRGRWQSLPALIVGVKLRRLPLALKANHAKNFAIGNAIGNMLHGRSESKFPDLVLVVARRGQRGQADYVTNVECGRVIAVYANKLWIITGRNAHAVVKAATSFLHLTILTMTGQSIAASWPESIDAH